MTKYLKRIEFWLALTVIVPGTLFLGYLFFFLVIGCGAGIYDSKMCCGGYDISCEEYSKNFETSKGEI